ncbi:Endomembrane protein 70 [Phytophthora megakarya]|uniref:Endomembrane protein 70 n=1 Tax=Phytophthora megakarya TaxID=4795 RepID=A0A225X1B0_9STRA|nr:Endomembrane protein 70 [Phytophthora megakarya]
MKIIKAVVHREPPPRWGYLAFVVGMLYLLRRAKIKDIPRENVLSFFAAMLPTELSHKFLAINAVVMYKLHTSKRPVLSEWVGSIAAFMQCIVMVRLTNMYRANISTKYLIRDAMLAADIPSSSVQRIGEMSWKQWLGVFLPVPQSMGLSMAFPGVAKVQTVTFAHVGKNKTTSLLMDVYKHRDTPSNAPIVLYIHGGAWVMSTRETPPLPCIYQIAARGWVVCVFDYQKSPKIAFPEHLIDAKRAIAYLRRNAREKFDANPDYIVVGGESAGGHLASLMALTAADKSLQPGFEEVDASVRGCIDTYGVHDFKDRHGVYFYKDKDHIFVRFIELLVMQKKMSDADDAWEKASPVGWLREENASDLPSVIPPFLISHGTLDTLVPFGSSQVFYEQLQLYRQRAQQTPVGGVCDVFLELPGAHHAFNYVMSPRAMAHGQAVVAFLDNLYAKTKDIPLQSEADLAQIEELVEAANVAAFAAEMKVLKPEPPSYLSYERLTRWAYLAFAVSTLYVVERAKNNKIPRENFFGMAASLLPTELSHKIAVVHAFVHACLMGFLLKKKVPIFSHWSGAIAGLVQCVVAANLMKWYRQNLSSKEIIRDAFTSSDIAPEQLKDIGHMTLKRWMSVFLPLPQPMAVSLSYPGVTKIRTVTYAHVGKTKTKKLLMDVYKHQDAPSNAPMFLYIHGGGWVIGDRRIPPFACVYQVASMGWVVCVIDYRLSPGVAFPTHLIDSKRAVAYLRQNARAQFDANPEFIVVGGESAGGHLASLVGLTADDTSLQPGFEDVDTSVRAVVDNYGVHDFTDRHGIYFSRDKTHGLIHYLEFLVMQKKLKDNNEDFERASPIAYLDDERAVHRRGIIPPFMITHGTHDNTVAFKDSHLFFDRLQRYRQNLPEHISSYQDKQIGGVQDVFVRVPYASHMFNFLLSPRALAHCDAVCAFLGNVYKKTKDVPLEARIFPARVDDIVETSEMLSATTLARL